MYTIIGAAFRLWCVCVYVWSLPKTKSYVYLNLALGFSKTPMKALLFYVKLYVNIL
jgi:hypothetical protein